MKTVTVTEGSAEIRALLDQVRDEDLVFRLDDGSEFLLSAIDDFDREISQTRRNEKLMALLDEGQTNTDGPTGRGQETARAQQLKALERRTGYTATRSAPGSREIGSRKSRKITTPYSRFPTPGFSVRRIM